MWKQEAMFLINSRSASLPSSLVGVGVRGILWFLDFWLGDVVELILIFTEYFCQGSLEIVFADWYIEIGLMFVCDAVTLF